MQRLTAALLSAALAAALYGMVDRTAGAAQVRGNWTVKKQTSPRPANVRTRQGRFNFLGLFDDSRSGRYGRRDPRVLAVTPPPERPRIYSYGAPNLVPLSSARLKGEPAGPGLPEMIRTVLKDGQAGIRVAPAHRKAILKFYATRGFRPVWTTPYGIRARAFPVLERLANSGDEAMDPAMYRIPVVWSVNGDLKAIESSMPRLARFDVELTAAALRYARHASGGIVNPDALSSYHDLKPPRVSPAAALQKLAASASPEQWLENLLPRHRAYGILRAALKKLRSGPTEEPLAPVASGPTIRLGGYDARIPLIRRYMIRLGFMSRKDSGGRKVASAGDVAPEGLQAVSTDAVAENDPALYDPALEKAIRDFQKKSGLKPDGIIGRGTLRALNARRGNGKAARARKIALNMERLRWMPRDFGKTHFLANQPAYELYLVRNGRTAWKTRIIIGKPTNQTAFFSDEMELVVFNPSWGVPQSIITKEMLPKLLRDPSWLDRQGYELTDTRGRRLRSSAVDWGSYVGSRKVPFNVRQPPGRKNALGHIKFLFPNSHSIYMHDTPARSLFKRKRRAFSHGCVRVQDPLTMAELVTGLDRNTIETKIGNGRNEQLRLKRKIPVHLAYFTAWPDDSGRIHFYPDVYGRDRLLQTALDRVVRALSVPTEPRT